MFCCSVSMSCSSVRMSYIYLGRIEHPQGCGKPYPSANPKLTRRGRMTSSM